MAIFRFLLQTGIHIVHTDQFWPIVLLYQSPYPDYVKYVSVNRWLLEEHVLIGKSIILLTFPSLLLKPNPGQSVRFLDILLILLGELLNLNVSHFFTNPSTWVFLPVYTLIVSFTVVILAPNFPMNPSWLLGSPNLSSFYLSSCIVFHEVLGIRIHVNIQRHHLCPSFFIIFMSKSDSWSMTSLFPA